MRRRSQRRSWKRRRLQRSPLRLDVSKRLRESRLAIQTRLLPPDHPDLLAAKQNLAATRAQLGDIAGARELFDAVLEARMRLLPPDHPDFI